MARRRRARPAEDPGDGYAGRRARPARRGRGNEALWLSLGGAAVVSVVLWFVFAGAASGKLEKEEATKAFRDFVQALLASDSRKAIAMMNEKESVAAYKPELYKNWASISAAEREQTLLDLYRWHKAQLENELQVNTIRELDKILDTATIEWRPVPNWVEISWNLVTEFATPDHWIVIVKEDPEKGWQICKFEKQE